jgi:hypothetical protein
MCVFLTPKMFQSVICFVVHQQNVFLMADLAPRRPNLPTSQIGVDEFARKTKNLLPLLKSQRLEWGKIPGRAVGPRHGNEAKGIFLPPTRNAFRAGNAVFANRQGTLELLMSTGQPFNTTSHKIR